MTAISIYYLNKQIVLSHEPPQDNSLEALQIINYYSGNTENSSLLEIITGENNLKKFWLWSEQFTGIDNEFTSQFKKIIACGGIVKNSANQYLFIKRLGKWDLPKGKQEVGETLEDTASREIVEECGLARKPEMKGFCCNTYHIYKEKEEWILKESVWYNFHYNGMEVLTPQTEENITAVSWLNNVDISNNVLSDTYPAISEIIKTHIL